MIVFLLIGAFTLWHTRSHIDADAFEDSKEYPGQGAFLAKAQRRRLTVVASMLFITGVLLLLLLLVTPDSVTTRDRWTATFLYTTFAIVNYMVMGWSARELEKEIWTAFDLPTGNLDDRSHRWWHRTWLGPKPCVQMRPS